MKYITKEEAINLLQNNQYKNYCGHQTVKILNIQPANTREECNSYTKAIVIKPNGRLEFGREYDINEIENIGYTIMLIEKIN